MAAFRNVLVRGYDDMDLMIVRDVLTNHLGDLGCFAACITRKLKEDKDQAAATEPPRNA